MARRPRQLSDGDRALWDSVAQSLRPLRQRGAPDPARVDPPPAIPVPEPRRPAAPRFEQDAPPLRQTVLRPSGKPEPALRWRAPLDDRPAPVALRTPGLDDGTARRMARGRLAPQARLDLHGMTAERAHAALTRFITGAWGQELRCVLVVTGKGRGEHGGRGDGLLRRDTPRWLGVPPLSGMVVGVFEAHARHGGGGALYVYLKRRRR